MWPNGKSYNGLLRDRTKKRENIHLYLGQSSKRNYSHNPEIYGPITQEKEEVLRSALS